MISGSSHTGALPFCDRSLGSAHDFQLCRILRPPCGGVWQGFRALVVRGMRVPVRTLPASLAEGATAEAMLADFPTVSAEALRAVALHGAVW